MGVTNLLVHIRNSLHTGYQTTQVLPSGDEKVVRKPFKSFLFCIQEPPVREKKVTGFGRSHRLLSDIKCDRPRACIYASRDLNIWPLLEFTDGDVVTCLWKLDRTREIVVTSVYMDILDDGVAWPILKKLLSYCKSQGKQLLLCADTNAHSSLWG